MPGRVVPQPPPPLLTAYFPEYTEDTAHPLRALLAGTVSAIRGGSHPYLAPGEDWPRCQRCAHPLIPYLQINLASETTPTQFREHVHAAAPAGEGAGELWQLFVCAAETNAGFCFEAWTMQQAEGDGDGEPWLLRTVRVDPASANAEDEGEDEAHEAVRATLADADEILPEQVIAAWMAGREETVDVESYWDYPEGFYEEHEPAEGLKLLGYPVLGKYYYSARDIDQCKVGDDGPHFDWRCLVQLGTREEDNPFFTTGNIFIDQCERHPQVLDAVVAGTW
ncbi:hypothetical protein C2E23DRAFT_869922 [Lenzites betulinus]|nr:hypothetical protein C2E23DRAFT_869922 [Lenzites betulinus]